MLHLDQYDKGVWRTRASARAASLLAKWLPCITLLGGIVAFIVILVRDPTQESLVSGDESYTKVSEGLGAAFLLTAAALMLSWAAPYIMTESGRLTYDRVRTVTYALPPKGPKGVAIVAMLASDLVLQPCLMFVNRHVAHGSTLQAAASYMLFSSSPYVSPKNFLHPPANATAVFAIPFAFMFLIAILTAAVGLCAIVPTYAYPGSAADKKPVLQMTAYGGLTLTMSWWLYRLLSVFPCNPPYMNSHGKKLVNATMYGDPTLECLGTGHSVYMTMSLVEIVILGLATLSGIQQLRLLDHTFDAFEIYAIRADPLCLAAGTAARSAVLICSGMQLNATVTLLVVLGTNVVHFTASMLWKYSSVHSINTFAKVVAALNLFSAGCMTILLAGTSQGYASLTGHHSSGGELQDFGDTSMVVGVGVCWLVVEIVVVVAFVIFHRRHYKGQWFDDGSGIAPPGVGSPLEGLRSEDIRLA